MYWDGGYGLNCAASLLADPSMFDSKEIEKPKKKGGFFNGLMKKEKSPDLIACYCLGPAGNVYTTL